jgi:hypothetical protein
VSVPLLLDEMHAPVLAPALHDRGHDVIAVVEQDELRALTEVASIDVVFDLCR